MEKRLLQSLIIRNDLEEAKSEIEAKGLICSIAHIKTAFLAFHNLCELEKTIRSLYKDHRALSTKFKVRANICCSAPLSGGSLSRCDQPTQQGP